MNSTTDKIKAWLTRPPARSNRAPAKPWAIRTLRLRALAEGKGEAQQAVGKAKDAVKKVIDKA